MSLFGKSHWPAPLQFPISLDLCSTKNLTNPGPYLQHKGAESLEVPSNPARSWSRPAGACRQPSPSPGSHPLHLAAPPFTWRPSPSPGSHPLHLAAIPFTWQHVGHLLHLAACGPSRATLHIIGGVGLQQVGLIISNLQFGLSFLEFFSTHQAIGSL